jgi:stage II sporulation protein D
MRRIFFVVILCLLPSGLGFSQISIRIFARTKPSTVIFSPVHGDFFLRDGNSGEVRLRQGDIMAVTLFDGKVLFRTLSGVYGSADSIRLEPGSPDGLFTLRAPGRLENEKLLEGTLCVRSFPGSLQVLNLTTAENCLPGVVRAEAGRLGPADYFRAQAVVARTYVYRNIERHSLDGYNLCDDIHCQVYPGVVTDSVIVNACRRTEGMVLVDSDNMLIEAAFHGNCGGETAASSDVWLAGYPYLVSVKDPWCSYSASSKWKKSISLAEWTGFLRSKGIDPGNGTALTDGAHGQAGRIINRSVEGRTVSSEEIRLRFNLRSAYFFLSASGDSILVSGKGYGHGVGLCQDGAKHMAEKKISFDRITGFYYPGTIITDIKNARRPVRP